MIEAGFSDAHDVELNIVSAPLRHALTSPDRIAATADGGSLTYAELCHAAGQLGSWLVDRGAQRLAILGSRSLGCFVGVLGSAWAGAAYVPLSLKAPAERLVAMLGQACPDVLLVDQHGALLIDDLVAAAAPKLIIAADEIARARVGPVLGHVATLAELHAQPMPPLAVGSESTAYIIFTSGTTGTPKGVVVSVGARAALIAEMQRWYPLRSDDRVAETADLSFDISVANMILAWQHGASLHAVPAAAMIAPARFIRAHAITIWCSVPSVIATMIRTGALRPAIFETLRHSIFIGEALPVVAARAWQQAAPCSRVDNLYGPTEATFGCFGYRLDPSAMPETDIAPIGRPFAGTDAVIVDSELRILGTGKCGELALAGPQLADGYLGHPDLTRARFPTRDGKRWYLTGDAAVCDKDGTFHHRGRLDNQLKVLGYRVELEDVESHARSVSGAITVAVMGWPQSGATADMLIGFTVGAERSSDAIRTILKERLPSYMIPQVFHPVDAVPLSSNGKLDRRRLVELLPDRDAAHG